MLSKLNHSSDGSSNLHKTAIPRILPPRYRRAEHIAVSAGVYLVAWNSRATLLHPESHAHARPLDLINNYD